MQIEHKKNTAYYLAFPMISSSSPESFATGLTVADTAYYKDGAGTWTSLAITDTVSEIASTGVYEVDLSASELNHDQVIIKMTATGAADTAYLLDMRTKLVSDLNDVSAADVNTQCDTAISDAALATAANLATVDANVDAILVDTNELQADWTNGGRLDLIIDELTTNVDAIETDTQDIQSRLPAALVSGKMDCDVTAISGDTIAADRLEAAMDGVVTGTAQTGTLSTTQMTTDLTEATDDHYVGRLITFTGGALDGQQTDITDYSGTSGLLTFTLLTEAPLNGQTFYIS